MSRPSQARPRCTSCGGHELPCAECAVWGEQRREFLKLAESLLTGLDAEQQGRAVERCRVLSAGWRSSAIRRLLGEAARRARAATLAREDYVRSARVGNYPRKARAEAR